MQKKKKEKVFSNEIVVVKNGNNNTIIALKFQWIKFVALTVIFYYNTTIRILFF